MKKQLVLSICSAFLSALTLLLGLIFLDTKTALIMWLMGACTVLATFVCFLIYYQRYLFAKEDNPKKSTNRELNKVKEKIIKIKENTQDIKTSSLKSKLKTKGIEEGLEKAIEIIEQVQKEEYDELSEDAILDSLQELTIKFANNKYIYRILANTMDLIRKLKNQQ